ncbi:TetR/AcrR family transcriptional regulator [Streptomyces sp. NPDC017890]|uniref:TetR/AcrR family transcriptional regulator n=1 Tax=Streptomyces sp. NPDC017890 TaxID=3365015 RepID=UPI0037A743B2
MQSEIPERSPEPFPASLEVAWGLRERPHKGPKRGLTLDGIVTAAIAVADAEGIEAVSMSRVAKEIGASTMALYRYVSTKDELVMLMVDAAIGPPVPLPETSEGDWRAGLEHWATAMRDSLLTHLWTVPLLAAHGPPVTPNQLAWLDQCMAALAHTRLGHGEKVAVALLISGQVRGELSIRSLLHQDPEGSAGRMAGYGKFLRRVTESGRLPALAQAVADGAFDDLDADTAPTADDFDDFAFGLARALDGVAAYLGE